MQVEFELSQSLISPDGQGIRVGAVLSLNSGSETAISIGKTNGIDSKNINSESNVNEDDSSILYRIVLGNQGGAIFEYKIPHGFMMTEHTTFQHDHSITSILSNDTLYITGCKDSNIRIFSGADHTLVSTLKGHEKPVSSLAWVQTSSAATFLVSGSWDGTAKVWDVSNGMLITTLSGHENSVCVTGLTAGNELGVLYVATGSAGIAQGNQIVNHTVRLWHVDSTMKTPPRIVKTIAMDHDGPIRDINSRDQVLLTCSNDGTVKLRSPSTGTCNSTLAFLPELQQHPPMFLSVRIIDEDCIVASAEDGHVVVWVKVDNEFLHPPQIIRHTQTVWSIVPLPNGDFGTCCQDGTFRIFTRCTDRMAPIKERDAFTKDVEDTIQAQQNGPTSDEIAKLPHWDYSLQQRGTSEGQVHLFQRNGIAIAAQWSVASQTWIEVGQVMGRPGGGGDGTSTGEDNVVDGIRYDFVFPIEVDGTGGSVISLKIGYNIGENPFVAAQRFIDNHSLPQYHLNEIADYIQQRSGSTSTPTIGGVGGEMPVASTGVPIGSYQYIPAKSYKTFDLPSKNVTATLEKMKTKIFEFQLLPDESKRPYLDSLISSLNGNVSTTLVSENEIQMIAAMMESAPKQLVFPVLDLARLLVLRIDSTSTPAKVNIWKNHIIPQVAALCQSIKKTNNDVPTPITTQASAPTAAIAPETAIPMLALRLFANAFAATSSSREAATANADSIISCIEMFVQSGNKSIRASLASTLYNVCHYIHSSLSSEINNLSSIGEKQLQQQALIVRIISIINTIMDSNVYETEPLHQVMIGLGTLIYSNTFAKNIAKSAPYYLTGKVEPAAYRTNNNDVKTTAKEIYSLLS